ncbi:MAG: tRNA lysidine(34) synthetase TilS [Myxococcota bacterium]
MLPNQVQRTLVERALVATGDHVLVACSGGPDSTVLLHVLHRIRRDVGITLCAAAIDHGLRVESAEEVEGVRALANALGVPFATKRIHVPKDGASVQGRARALRYEALRELAAEVRATRIAVGHTLDDQAETVIARLLRGSGIRGLRGIEPRREDGVVRPLIDCRRSEVLAYAAASDLSFVLDPSNQATAFERVRIRKEILPALVREDPRVAEHLAALADEAMAVEVILDEAVPALPENGTLEVDAATLRALSPPLRTRWLRRWLARETGVTPGRVHLDQVGRLLTGAGEVLLGSGWAVRRGGGRLYLEYREHRPTRTHRS